MNFQEIFSGAKSIHSITSKNLAVVFRRTAKFNYSKEVWNIQTVYITLKMVKSSDQVIKFNKKFCNCNHLNGFVKGLQEKIYH